MPVQILGNLSRLLGSFYFDRRDNVIDTGRGFFHSTSAEIAPEWLGSTAYYRKYLNQDFYFLPLPGTVVLASAARVELAVGARPDLHHQRAPARRRVHHGARLRRRVARAAGARGRSGHRTSLLVLNEELRFPIVRRFRGALFVDHASLLRRVQRCPI